MASLTKPFLRWVGGKRSILTELLESLPHQSWYDTYREPFVGGGALFFAMRPQVALLSDINPELINIYKVVRNKTQCNNFIEYLKHHAKQHSLKHYMECRVAFNHVTTGKMKVAPSYQASLFYYLNKTCFNGLWRVNKKGEFNVPMDKTKKELEISVVNIRACGALLRNSAALETCSFQDFFGKNGHKIESRQFWFLDPPYDGKHNSYTAGGFTDKDQADLAILCYRINAAGSYFMLTNSSTPLIKKLYKDYHICTLSVKHSVAASANKRTTDKEVIITNYEA